MEVVSPELAAKLSLALFGRVFCGLSYDESEAIAEKTMELAAENADVSDIMEVWDLVWGATLKAGLVNPGDWNVPVHPLSVTEQMTAARLGESFAMYHAHSRKRPKEYDDPSYVARKPKKKKRKAM